MSFAKSKELFNHIYSQFEERELIVDLFTAKDHIKLNEYKIN